MRSEEEQLLAEWSPAHLEALGAALRADGDPRGDLIAIDFVLERETSRAVRDALAEEKKQLHIAWLGEIGENVETKFGFIEEIRDEQEAFLEAFDVLVPYLRVLDVWGDRACVEAIVDRIAEAPRPWIHALEASSFRDTEKPLIRKAAAAKLIAATPRLQRLHAKGHLVVDDFPHPAITHVIADGWDALLALAGASTLPNATALDYAFHPATIVDREPPPDIVRAGMIQPAGFPRLTTLDLSRNELREDPMGPNCLGGATPLFDVLSLFAVLPQLEVLRVPSIRTAAQAAQLQTARARMPRLRTVEVARTYLPVPQGRIDVVLPPPVMWLAGDAIRNVDAVLFQVGDTWVRGDLDDAYEVCELEYATMTPAQRAGWDALWDLVDRAGRDEELVQTLSRAHVDAVLETIGNDRHYYWNDVAKQLATQISDPVNVRRIDGFATPIEREPAKPRTHGSSERIEEHERALQEHWDLDRLAVYADDLQELGDTRGELISVDLKLAKAHASDLDFRHDDLHEEIFGYDHRVTSKHGFTRVDISLWGDSEKGLPDIAPEAMRYLGECELSGPVEKVVEHLPHLLAERRPWLRVLRVETMGARSSVTSFADELSALCPSLETLELVMDERHPMFAGFVHPRVRALRITGACALEELGGPWPAVTKLDFAYGAGAHVNDQATAITSAKLPALRILDLSRNERAHGLIDRDRRQQCSFDFYDVFREFDRQLLANLVELTLPAPRSQRHVDVIRAALDRMPRLERLEIARRYPRGPDVALHHPIATIHVPAVSPWIPADEIEADSRLQIEGVSVPFADIALAMEDHYDSLPEAGQRAWAGFWAVADRRGFEIDAQTTYDAFDALRVANPYTYPWTEKVTVALHALAIAQQTIRIRRDTR